MTDVLFVLLAMVAGAGAPIQAGVNSQLRLHTQDPVLAALISFGVGTAALFVYSLIGKIPWPALKTVMGIPWWMWTGGVFGAFLVVVTIILAPTLGATTTLGLLVAGQMIASLILDHYGLIGYQEHPTTVWRMVGVGFLVAGVVLIKKF
jgi:bacterial/archaeal transporter family-2 protein